MSKKEKLIPIGVAEISEELINHVEAKPTKMEVATEIYKLMKKQHDVKRKDIVARFVADANLSVAAASTYYQLIKGKLGN